MAQRVRLIDCVLSDLPKIIGATRGDLPRIAQAVNRACERLTYCEEMNEEGPPGGFAEMVFSVDRKRPYLTCPRGVSRLLAVDSCQRPGALRNPFYDYLEFGDGRLPKSDRWGARCSEWQRSAYQRNNAVTFADIDPPNQQIQIFALNASDTMPNPQTGAIPRVLLQGLDQNGHIITTQDGSNTVQGEFVTLAQPYALSVNTFSPPLTGIQKDATQGEVQIFQSDPYWGMAEILLTMEPGETMAWYPRYFLSGLPRNCCPSARPIYVNKPPPTCGCPDDRAREFVQVTVLAKLDLVPVVFPTDYTLIGSVEAIIAECQAIRMSKMDDPAGRQQAEVYHKEAIRILRGQAVHTTGKNNVSANLALFGNARWDRVNLGMM